MADRIQGDSYLVESAIVFSDDGRKRRYSYSYNEKMQIMSIFAYTWENDGNIK